MANVESREREQAGSPAEGVPPPLVSSLVLVMSLVTPLVPLPALSVVMGRGGLRLVVRPFSHLLISHVTPVKPTSDADENCTIVLWLPWMVSGVEPSIVADRLSTIWCEQSKRMVHLR